MRRRAWFDEFGRVFQSDAISADDSYDSTRTTYDYVDRADTILDQLGNSTRLEYDAIDRQVKTKYPDTSNQQSIYSSESAQNVGITNYFNMNDSGLYVSHNIDENGNDSYEYTDILGQLRKRRVEAGGGQTLETFFDYDDRGNLITVIRPKGDSVNYRYNSLGWLLKEWAADYDTIFYEYDKLGNQIKRRDGRLTSLGPISVTYIDSSSGAIANCTTAGQTVTDTLFVAQDGLIKYILTLQLTSKPGTYSFVKSLRGITIDSFGVDGSSCPSCAADSEFQVQAGDTVVVTATVDPTESFSTAHASAYWAIVFETETYHRFTDYDALSRVTAQGLLHQDDTCNIDSCWIVGVISKDTVTQYYYDQWVSTNSRGRLSLSFVENGDQDYAEKYDYDARGRIVRQTSYFDAVLNETLEDSIYVSSLMPDYGMEVAEFIVDFDSAEISYELRREFNADCISYIAIFKNDILIGDTLCWDGVTYFDTLWDTLICMRGDRIRLEAYDDPMGGDIFYGVARYTRFNIPQRYATGREYVTEYTYNLADQVTSIRYPADYAGDYIIVTYSYDDRGRLASVGDSANPIRYSQISYTARDEIKNMVLGDSIQIVDYIYNSRGWLESINGGNSSTSGDKFGQMLFYSDHPDFPGERYRNGNILGQTISINEVLTQDKYHYVYDEADRLTRVDYYSTPSILDTIENYTYDNNGNRLSGIIESDTTIYSYISGTNLLSATTGGITSTYYYDASGNITTDVTKVANMNYNIFGQMDTVSLGTEHYMACGYTSGGLRVYKSFVRVWDSACDTTGGIGWLEPEFMGGESSFEYAIYEYSDDDDFAIMTGEGTGEGGELPPPPPPTCEYRDSSFTIYVRGAGGDVLAEFSDIYGINLKNRYIYAGSQRIAMVDQA
ncbi:MAG: hypothetical protein IIB00_10405, partial [candidate division Zixibacteria bacterium]|nr:hypothetical protein [candidate division Zixibacteria bacterium]